MTISYPYKSFQKIVFSSHRAGVFPLHLLPRRSKGVTNCTGKADLAFCWNSQVLTFLGRLMETSLFHIHSGKHHIRVLQTWEIPSHVWDLGSHSNQLSNNHCLLPFLFLEVQLFQSSKHPVWHECFVLLQSKNNYESPHLCSLLFDKWFSVTGSCFQSLWKCHQWTTIHKLTRWFIWIEMLSDGPFS